MSRLIKIIEINKRMKLKTGLRIVGAEDIIQIGGIDKSIIKDPLTGDPYIPGSSLKGALRSSLEVAKGKEDVCSCGRCRICKLFGNSNTDKQNDSYTTHTRIIVRDSFLTDESKKILNEVLPFGVEIKKENTIDRVKGTSKSLRTFDRIPAGVEFNINIVLRIFDGDNEKEIIDTLNFAFKLVEKGYIGGCGTRGYGQVEFVGEDTISEFDVKSEVERLIK